MFKSDLRKYKRYSNKPALVLVLTTQGLWALWVYRCFNSVYRARLPFFIKKPILVIGVICQKWIEIVAGISLPYAVSLGHSCYIGHFGNIIINSTAIIGNNCNISQGVTIGVSGEGVERGVPIIEDNVYIGANAVIAGKLVVGSNVVVGANALVIKDVPSNCSVGGVPAKIISNKGSENYI